VGRGGRGKVAEEEEGEEDAEGVEMEVAQGVEL